MPSHRLHRYLDKIILGQEYPQIYWEKDKAFKQLGARHRIVAHPFHNLVKAMQRGDRAGALLALADPELIKVLQEKDGKKQMASVIHDMADLGLSSHKDIKAVMEVLARLDKG